jgi:hypothetical protein
MSLPFRLVADRWSIARVLLTTVSWHRSHLRACRSADGISGVAIAGLGTGGEQKLTFEFRVEDSLRAILASAELIARAFPPSPSTQFALRSRSAFNS